MSIFKIFSRKRVTRKSVEKFVYEILDEILSDSETNSKIILDLRKKLENKIISKNGNINYDELYSEFLQDLILELEENDETLIRFLEKISDETLEKIYSVLTYKYSQEGK